MIGRKAVVYVVFLLVIPFIVKGCVTFPDVGIEKNGRRFGVTKRPFKGQWWHYYERALSFMDGCFWKQAESDLREAIRGRESDKKAARTYGRRFLDLPEYDPGYFPHRELGVVLFHQDRIDEAIHELEISLESEASAKAQLYLDRSRKIKIERGNLDHQPPEITILSPADDFWTNASSVVIRGKTTDDTFVRHIAVGGKKVRVDVSNPEIRFRKEVQVLSGKNDIPVLVSDLMGKQSRIVVTVNVDRIGPIIGIEESVEKDYDSSSIRLKGNVFDNGGIVEISVNGETLHRNGEKMAVVEKSVQILPGQKTVEIWAKDLAGNVTSSNIVISAEETNVGANLLAMNKTDFITDARALKKKKSFPHQKLLAAKRDVSPPEIVFKKFENKTGNYVSYLKEILIEGSVSDDENMRQLYFNREKVEFFGKNKNEFTYIHSLEKGPNVIAVRAIDAAGNETKRTLMITHMTPSVREYKSRLRLEIKDFKQEPENLNANLLCKEALDSAILAHKRFQVLIQDELAERVNADCIVRGSIAKQLSSLEIWVHLYLYKADKKEISDRLAKVNAYRENKKSGEELVLNGTLIDEMIREIHLRLVDEIPLVEGKVVGSAGTRKITTDLGQETNVKSGMDLIVYQINEKEIDRDFEKLGRGSIDEIEADKSFAEVREGDAAAIREGHYVITR